MMDSAAGSCIHRGREGWRRDASAWAWRVVCWRHEGRLGLGDAMVACAVCRKHTYLNAALDRVGESAGAPLCAACWGQAHVDHANIPSRLEWRQAGSRRRVTWAAVEASVVEYHVGYDEMVAKRWAARRAAVDDARRARDLEDFRRGGRCGGAGWVGGCEYLDDLRRSVGAGTDDSFIIAIVPVSVCVAGGPTIETGRYEDCPWCGFAEGTVEDCHCGLRVCRVCVDQEEGLCVCGHDFNGTLSE